jgi:hypothetical protein
MVSDSSVTSAFCRPICAARTAHAIVKLEQIRITVLMPPSVTSRYRCAHTNTSGWLAR